MGSCISNEPNNDSDNTCKPEETEKPMEYKIATKHAVKLDDTCPVKLRPVVLSFTSI